MNRGASQYKKTSVNTATPGQILLLLYEAAIKNVKKAIECIDRQDIPGKGVHIGKTHDIINELAATLDHKVGGKIAEDLERLYNFMTERLLKANLENDKASLETVLKLLENLLSGWRVAVEEVQKGQAKQ